MKELGRVSVVRLVKVPPFLMLVANDDKLYAGPAWTDENAAFTCAADTNRYHVYFVKGGYSLLDGMHYLPDLKPRFP